MLGDVLTGNSINAGKAIAMTVIGAVIGAATGAGATNVGKINSTLLGKTLGQNYTVTSVVNRLLSTKIARTISWNFTRSVVNNVLIGIAGVSLLIIASTLISTLYEEYVNRK